MKSIKQAGAELSLSYKLKGIVEIVIKFEVKLVVIVATPTTTQLLRNRDS